MGNIIEFPKKEDCEWFDKLDNMVKNALNDINEDSDLDELTQLKIEFWLLKIPNVIYRKMFKQLEEMGIL